MLFFFWLALELGSGRRGLRGVAVQEFGVWLGFGTFAFRVGFLFFFFGGGGGVGVKVQDFGGGKKGLS